MLKQIEYDFIISIACSKIYKRLPIFILIVDFSSGVIKYDECFSFCRGQGHFDGADLAVRREEIGIAFADLQGHAKIVRADLGGEVCRPMKKGDLL